MTKLKKLKMLKGSGVKRTSKVFLKGFCRVCDFPCGLSENKVIMLCKHKNKDARWFVSAEQLRKVALTIEYRKWVKERHIRLSAYGSILHYLEFNPNAFEQLLVKYSNSRTGVIENAG